MGFDGKYGRVTTEFGDIPNDEPVFVFRGRDKLITDVLGYYAEICEEMGVTPQHVASVEETLDRIDEWQKTHPGRVRLPDSKSYFSRIGPQSKC